MLPHAAVERARQAGRRSPSRGRARSRSWCCRAAPRRVAIQGHAGPAEEPLPADRLVEATEQVGARVGVARSDGVRYDVRVMEEALADADVPGHSLRRRLPVDGAASCAAARHVSRQTGPRKSGPQGGRGAGSSQVSMRFPRDRDHRVTVPSVGVPVEEHAAGSVPAMICRSSPSDQLRRYSRSYSTRARIFSIVSVSPRWPFTWAQPVMPGLDLVPDHVGLDDLPVLLVVRDRVRARPDDAHACPAGR